LTESFFLQNFIWLKLYFDRQTYPSYQNFSQSEESLIIQMSSSPPGTKFNRYFTRDYVVKSNLQNKSVFRTCRQTKLDKQTKLYFLIIFSQKLSAKWPFGQINPCKNSFSVKRPKFFRSIYMFVKSKFGQMTFRWHELSV
jgi:hypothetical protein